MIYKRPRLKGCKINVILEQETVLTLIPSLIDKEFKFLDISSELFVLSSFESSDDGRAGTII